MLPGAGLRFARLGSTAGGGRRRRRRNHRGRHRHAGLRPPDANADAVLVELELGQVVGDHKRDQLAQTLDVHTLLRG